MSEYQTSQEGAPLWLDREHANPVTHSRDWSPRTDDGDALRLFCALPWLCIETSDLAVTVRERGKPKEQSRVYLMWTEWLDDHNGDLAAATRRAIVRAAAEIGKEMP